MRQSIARLLLLLIGDLSLLLHIHVLLLRHAAEVALIRLRPTSRSSTVTAAGHGVCHCPHGQRISNCPAGLVIPKLYAPDARAMHFDFHPTGLIAIKGILAVIGNRAVFTARGNLRVSHAAVVVVIKHPVFRVFTHEKIELLRQQTFRPGFRGHALIMDVVRGLFIRSYLGRV